MFFPDFSLTVDTSTLTWCTLLFQNSTQCVNSVYSDQLAFDEASWWVCWIWFFTSQSIFSYVRTDLFGLKDYCVLLKDTSQWGSNSQPLNLKTKHSTSEPLCSLSADEDALCISSKVYVFHLHDKSILIMKLH